MRKITQLTLIISLCTLLSGCLFHGFVPPFTQGNMINESKVDELHTGMSVSRVVEIMGNPVLVDTFSNHRMDYVYIFVKKIRIAEHQKVIVTFSNGVVTNIERN
ncbi:MAG: outer membrane protein assembly factor BamE [Gammaproteobacteria bacterium]